MLQKKAPEVQSTPNILFWTHIYLEWIRVLCLRTIYNIKRANNRAQWIEYCVLQTKAVNGPTENHIFLFSQTILKYNCCYTTKHFLYGHQNIYPRNIFLP